MLRRLFAGALALALSIGFATDTSAQTGQGASPLTGAKGGTNNGFMQFSGPAAPIKTYVMPNVSGTIAMLEVVQTWTGAQSFPDGNLILLGAISGTSTLKAPAIGGGTATLFPGTDTVAGTAAAQTLTNKTLDGANNTFSNIPFSALTGTLPVTKGGTGIASAAQHDIIVGTAANTLAAKSLPDCPDTGGQHLNYVRSTQAFECGTSGDGAGGGGGAGGAWTNTPIAKTGPYAPVTGDCGGTVSLGGNTAYALTLNAASGFADGCPFLVIVTDSRGKLIIPQLASSSTSFTIGIGLKAFITAAGLPIVDPLQRYRVYSLANPANWMSGKVEYSGTTFSVTVDAFGGSGTFSDWQIAPEIRLWPGQWSWVTGRNSVWRVNNPPRWKLPNTTELCVRPDGSDSNDGLPAGTDCLQTIQEALLIIGREWDGGGYRACNIGLYAGGSNTFGPGSQTGESVGCYITMTIRSNGLTWTHTNSCYSFGDKSTFIIDARLVPAFTLRCNTANNPSRCAFNQHQTSIFDMFGTFQYVPSGDKDCLLFVDADGRATIDATLVIGDGTLPAKAFESLFNCDDNCASIQVSGSIGCSANVTPGRAFIARSGSKINTNVSWTACTGFAASLVTGGSKMMRNGTAIPGGVSLLNPDGSTGGQLSDGKI
jgi:hypothetical protein